MKFSKQIGGVLAETLEEMILAEDLGVSLNEIRDPKSIKQLIGKLQNWKNGGFGVARPETQEKLRRLSHLYNKKVSSSQNNAQRQKETGKKQHQIAKSFGYKKVGKGKYVHDSTGHTLNLNPDNSWSHKKNGALRSKKGTPLADLKTHLQRVHEGVESVELVSEQELNEIRQLARIQKRLSALAIKPSTDPNVQQELLALQQLKSRAQEKQRMTMGEAEKTPEELSKERHQKLEAMRQKLAGQGMYHIKQPHVRDRDEDGSWDVDEGEITKRAVIRDPSVPVGTSAEAHVNCGCGTKVSIKDKNNACPKCKTVYDSRGWIQK